MSPPQDHMPGRRPTVFVERQTYRRRRVMDAARLLPMLGILLYILPLLWPAGPQDGVATSRMILYIFGVWAMLILVTIRLSRGLRDLPQTDRPPSDSGGTS